MWDINILLAQFRYLAIGGLKCNNIISPSLACARNKENLDFTFAANMKYCSF